MSEFFPAGSQTVPATGSSCGDLELAVEQERTAAMPLDASMEQARAVKGALNFMAALISFYGEMIEREKLDHAGTAASERPPLQ
jgi:hypothetical protein